MNTLALDLKPWICVNCSDRFVRDQKPLGEIHWTEFKPRPLYSQSWEDYS